MIIYIFIILLATIIFKDFKISKDLVIKSKKNITEKVLFLVGIGVISYINYAYATMWTHYLLGVLIIVLYVIDYFKSGITSNGFASIYRGSQFVPWDRIQKVNINKGKNIKVSYSGDGFFNSLYFESKDYDRIIKFLDEKLPNVFINID